MKFKVVAETFHQIEKTSSRVEITKLLAGLLGMATPEEASLIAYMSLGVLNPVYVGTQFNFAEKGMQSVLSKLLDKDLAKIKEQRKRLGDLGLVLEAADYKGSKDALTLIEVNTALHDIHDIAGTGSQETKERKLLALLETLDAISGKYVVRIIIGKLRLGFSDMTLLDAFSWMQVGDKSLRKPLEHAYNVSADIGFIIKELKADGVAAIEEADVEPGIPIRPAAAERLEDAKAIVTKLGDCVAQPKLDGFRLQVHRWKDGDKDEVRFYSRNLQNMSEMFPDLKAEVLKCSSHSFVVEGEAIAYDPETQTFLPFQETSKRRRKHGVEQKSEELPLQLFFFDLLYEDGKSLLDESHKARRQELEKIVDRESSVIKIIDEENITTAEQLEDYFNENISLGLEGLVVKKPNSMYQPGKRNFNWIKLKRQETGHLDDTLDCVILGYYDGHGKRASFGIGALLVGVYNQNEDRFETCAKIGTGLKDDGWREAKKRCDEHAQATKPKDVVCAKELVPDVWVAPVMVCQIRADEISRSPSHTAGLTQDSLGLALRFPRFMGYRSDKSPKDATTVSELDHLYELQFKKEKITKKK